MANRQSVVLLAPVGALLLTFGGCATMSDAGNSPKVAQTNYAVPANYRQLLANYVAKGTDMSKVLKAEISPPGAWEDPIFGGSRPIACTRITIRGSIIDQTYSTGFMFEKGQIAEAFDPAGHNPAAGGAFAGAVKNAVTCGKLTYGAFPEFSKSKLHASERQ